MELYHHGIKGMKWGVWNEETAARRNGRLKYIVKPLTDRKKNKYKLNNDGTLSKKLVNDITKTYSQKNYDDHAKVWDKRIKEAGVSLDDVERYRHKYTYDGSKKSRRALDNIINNSPTGKQKEKQRLEEAKQYAKDVNDIYNSMSKQEKMNIQSRYGYHHHPESLIDAQTAYDAIKKGAAFIEKENDTPVSFLYLTRDGYDNVVIGTRSGAEFRNKGYAQKNIEKAKEWLNSPDRNKYETKLQWVSYNRNKASNNLAVKSGFTPSEWNDEVQYDWENNHYYLDRNNT